MQEILSIVIYHIIAGAAIIAGATAMLGIIWLGLRLYVGGHKMPAEWTFHE